MINNLPFDKESLFHVKSGIFSNRDFKRNEDHISETIIDIMPIDTIHLKSDCFNGSQLNGVRVTFFSFSLQTNLLDSRLFPEWNLYNVKNKSVLNDTTIYMEDDIKNTRFYWRDFDFCFINMKNLGVNTVVRRNLLQYLFVL